MPAHEPERPAGLLRGDPGFYEAITAGMFNVLDVAVGEERDASGALGATGGTGGTGGTGRLGGMGSPGGTDGPDGTGGTGGTGGPRGTSGPGGTGGPRGTGKPDGRDAPDSGSNGREGDRDRDGRGSAGVLEPDAIVFPENEADLVEIVRAATETGQRLAVRSGGHSWVASPVRGDGILVDMSAFDHITLDAVARTAVVGPAVRGGRLATQLAAAGLAFPVGHCGTPGIGGYLLGGGLGVNWGHWLPACFSVTRVRIVTAAGRVLDATATENADWFWLARGAGPGFPGIVTEFELALQPLPAAIRVSTWQFPLSELDTVSAWVTDASPRLASNVEVSLVTAGSERPGGAGADDANPLVVSVVATVFAAGAAEATEAVEPLGASVPAGLTVLDHGDSVPVPFEDLHVAADATYPEGARYLADTFWTDLDLHDAVAPLAALMERAPSGKSYVLTGMPANGRGADLLPSGEAAYGMHDRTLLIAYVIWDDPADDAANRAWLNEVADALLPVTTGHFLSESDIRHAPSRVARSFTYAGRERVEQLRAALDPEHLFHGYPGERNRA